MTIDKFDLYINELIKWNQSVNLVQEKTIESIIDRHINDSLQLINYIQNKDSKVVDIGSGAGFPGMVLAIEGLTDVHLVEPITKKTVFLNHIKNIYKNNVTVHTHRWQDLKINNAEIITSRAFAPLTQLLEAMNFVSRETKNAEGLFLKGQKYEDELCEAKEKWAFEASVFQSQTHVDGKIIQIRRLYKK